MRKLNKNKGITLIALVISIIVMLILVAVSISMAVNGGLFNYAGKAVGDTENAIQQEQELVDGKMKIGDKWYDSIDDYLNGIESTGVKMALSISEGTKVAEKDIPVPTGFTHTEGTIDDGYVIKDTDGNEFVWVPVNKNQKLKLSIKSEKEIEEFKLYDPVGNIILELGNTDIENGYVNNNIEPTINGTYIAIAIATDGVITQKTLTVRSLYKAYILTKDELVQEQGHSNFEEFITDGMDCTIEEWLNILSAPTLDVSFAIVCSNEFGNMNNIVDYYSESVSKNGGFYIGRYEAGTTSIGTGEKPVSKEGAYPYNSVTYSQAKSLAENMYEENDEYEVDLLTYGAWCRTLGWLCETGAKKNTEIFVNSEGWGNYQSSEFTITKGKYTEKGKFLEFSGIYKKEKGIETILTTGATERNSANKIYDLAGNCSEFVAIIKYDGIEEIPMLGGWCDKPSAFQLRALGTSDAALWDVAFRCAIYLK